MIFKDRTAAGQLLATELAKKNYPHPHIFALPRGGVPVAAVIAKALEAPLDLVVVRKLGMPFNPELGFGAIAPGGVEEIDTALLARFQVHSDDIQRIREAEKQELNRRIVKYRVKEPTGLSGQTAIIVDDGIATGVTMLAAVKYLRTFSPDKLVIAVPVAPDTATSQFAGLADEFVCLYFDEYFTAVGAYYEQFPQVSDTEVIDYLDKTLFEK